MGEGKSAIWAVVLAAGESSRMGSPKLVLPYKGSTVLGYLIRNIRDSGIQNITVVTGGWESEILKIVRALDTVHCRNSNFKDGMLSSVITGLRSLPGDAEAAMIFQGDQPAIPVAVIKKMVDARKQKAGKIIIPVFDGKRGHPVFIDVSLFETVYGLSGNTGLRELMKLNPELVVEVPVEEEMILKDIDTKEDYIEYIK
jgi:molybdenum cofactor cytidylyltransferase